MQYVHMDPPSQDFPYFRRRIRRLIQRGSEILDELHLLRQLPEEPMHPKFGRSLFDIPVPRGVKIVGRWRQSIEDLVALMPFCEVDLPPVPDPDSHMPRVEAMEAFEGYVTSITETLDEIHRVLAEAGSGGGN